MGNPDQYARCLEFKGEGALEMVHMLQAVVDANMAAIVLVEGGFQLWAGEELLDTFSKALATAPGFVLMGVSTEPFEA